MMDDAAYQKATQHWYRARLKQTENVKVLSSGNDERRAIRFEVLRALGIENGASVLDVGCGFGDFYEHLRSRGKNVRYSGVDIMPEFVEKAKARFPEADVRLRDVLKDPPTDGSYDYVVCSQVLNLRFAGADNEDMARRMLRALYRIARKGVACDFVTDHVDFKEGYLFYHSPERMFTFAKTLTRRVVLRHDYPLFEFCLYLYPNFDGWRR